MPAPDIESSSDTQPLVDNPYSSNVQPLPARHPINIFKRCLYIGLSAWGLHHFQVYQTIMHSPNVDHEWFKIGLATSVAILSLKVYVEMYAGKIQGKTVNYENFRNETHGVIFLILLASLSFHVALWPAYGAKTILIMMLFGFGILDSVCFVSANLCAELDRSRRNDVLYPRICMSILCCRCLQCNASLCALV